MTVFGGEPAASPTEILKGTPPPDDAGASTADRYDWQAAMATADVLALYLDCLEADGTVRDAAGFEVICEHHEDWALSDAGIAEIVSAKHRETGVGAFTTFRSLLVDGGVLNLYDRWLALDEAPRCRLVTTAGLASEAHTLTEIAAAFAQGMLDGPEQTRSSPSWWSRWHAPARCRPAPAPPPPPLPPQPRASMAKSVPGLWSSSGF